MFLFFTLFRDVLKKVIGGRCLGSKFNRNKFYLILSIVVDPGAYGIRIQELCGSVFGIRIRIHTYKDKIKYRQKVQDFTHFRHKFTI